MLEIKNLKKIYKDKNNKNEVQALRDVSFKVEEKEFVAIMGESGSGKTTLLNIISLIDDATEGSIKLLDREILNLKDSEKAIFRRENYGYVFQDFKLLDNFSVRENIILPLVLREDNPKTFNEKTKIIAKKLNILEVLDKYPSELSGGQKQRVATARALITNPKIILADEPTGQLDSTTSEELLNYFESINKDGNTILMVTHSNIAASFASRVLFIKDGRIFHQIYRGSSTRDEFYEKISNTLGFLRSGKNGTL